MKFKNIYIKKVYILFFAMLLLSIAIVSMSYSWLFKTITGPHEDIATTQTVNIDVYFLQPNNSRVHATLDPVSNRYLVNISDEEADNYVEKLRVDVITSGLTWSYARVFVSEMWYKYIDDGYGNITKTIFLSDPTIYSHPAGSWFDNRIYNSFYYYIKPNSSSGLSADISRGLIINPNENPVTIPFITGLSSPMSVISNGELQLEIRAEIVQFNRLKAFWNFDFIPNS